MVSQPDPRQDADGSNNVTAKRGFHQAPVLEDATSEQTAVPASKKAKTSKTRGASRLSAATREAGYRKEDKKEGKQKSEEDKEVLLQQMQTTKQAQETQATQQQHLVTSSLHIVAGGQPAAPAAMPPQASAFGASQASTAPASAVLDAHPVAAAPPASVHLKLSMPGHAAPPAAPVTAAPAASDAAAAAEGEDKVANAVAAATQTTAPASAAAAAVIGPAAVAATGQGPAEAEAVAAPVHVEVARMQGERGVLPEEGPQSVSMPPQGGVSGAPLQAPTAPASAISNAPPADAAQPRSVHLELSVPAPAAVPPAAPATAAPAGPDAVAVAEGGDTPLMPAVDAVPTAVPGTAPVGCTAGAVIGPAASAVAGHGPAKAKAVAASVHVEVGRVQGDRGLVPEDVTQEVSVPTQEALLRGKRPAKPNPKYAEDAP